MSWDDIIDLFASWLSYEHLQKLHEERRFLEDTYNRIECLAYKIKDLGIYQISSKYRIQIKQW